MLIRNCILLILETVDWGRNTSGAADEAFAAETVYRHDRSMTEQAAEFHRIPDSFPDYRNYPLI